MDMTQHAVYYNVVEHRTVLTYVISVIIVQSYRLTSKPERAIGTGDSFHRHLLAESIATSLIKQHSCICCITKRVYYKLEITAR